MKLIARFFSALFVPLFIPVLSSLLIIWANPYAFGGYTSPLVVTFLYYITLCTFIMPGVGMIMLKKLNLVDDINLRDRQQRIVPYFMIISCYSIAFYMLINVPIPSIVKAMMFGSLVSIIISFFWNNFLKVSAHANGMGSLLGVALALLFISNRNVEILLVIVVICSGLVLTSRLFLKAHTPKEIWIGYTLGFITQIIAFLVFYKLGL